jgi:hypothetical protein
MIPRSVLSLALLLACWIVAPADVSSQEAISANDSDMVWLKNCRLKVGLKKSSGGAIAWIGPAESDRNLINSYDRGRLVQQSWYGQEDGSLWNKQPWRWNPVQGGDWKGKAATILEERHEAATSFVKSRPVHWASGADLTDCVMEQRITLEDHLLHIRFGFTYNGNVSHPARHQELPAFFVDRKLDTLVLYDGAAPWTSGALTRLQPGFPNEYRKMTEHWAAYIDDNDFGIGCCVSVADELTCYRYGTDPAETSSCSYFAPIRTLAVTPRFQWSYDVWITTGTVAEIRTRFQTVLTKPSDAEPSDAEPSDAEPSDAEPSDAKPSDAKTSDAKTSDAKTSDAKTSDGPSHGSPSPVNQSPSDKRPQ